MESYEEILERMKNKFTELSGSNVNDDSDIGIRMKVLAGEIFSFFGKIFPETFQAEDRQFPRAISDGTAAAVRHTASGVHQHETLRHCRACRFFRCQPSVPQFPPAVRHDSGHLPETTKKHGGNPVGHLHGTMKHHAGDFGDVLTFRYSAGVILKWF